MTLQTIVLFKDKPKSKPKLYPKATMDILLDHMITLI